ncbi:MAG: hypothetical protein ABTQ29_12420 [Siculibacillus sp.]
MIPRSIHSPEVADAAIATVEDAEALVAEFETAMSELMTTISEETALVRAGRLFAATDLVERKNERLGRYLQIRTRIRGHVPSLSRLVPESFARMREDHLGAIEAIRANLAALAIAREVAEGIVRNVSTAVGRRAAPTTYGRNAAPPPVRLAAARGIAVDRRL